MTIPTNDIPYDKKFRKKVDLTISMTISNGRTAPKVNRMPPMIIRVVGLNLLTFILKEPATNQVLFT